MPTTVFHGAANEFVFENLRSNMAAQDRDSVLAIQPYSPGFTFATPDEGTQIVPEKLSLSAVVSREPLLGLSSYDFQSTRNYEGEFVARAFANEPCGCQICSGVSNAELTDGGPQSNGPTIVDNYTAILASQSWWNTGVVGRGVFLSYSFETAPAEYLSSVFSAAGLATFETLSETTRTVARTALDAFSAISGITFFEVASGMGDLAFGVYDLAQLGNPSAAGFAYLPGGFAANGFMGNGDVFLYKPANAPTANPLGLLLHEIGHALGLKHPFQGNITLRQDLDNYGNTVMSYTSGGVVRAGLADFDIQAIQHFYGTAGAKGNQISAWSWDASTSTLTQSGGLGDDSIQGIGAHDVINAGAGNDSVITRSGNDLINGDAGNDGLDGGIGADTLNGGEGNDSLLGGLGVDVLDGGVGNDSITGDEADQINGGAGDDTIRLTLSSRKTASVDGGDGIDRLTISLSTVFQPTGVVSVALSGAGSVLSSLAGVESINVFGLFDREHNIVGSEFGDYIAGSSRSDTLTGMGGNDTLWGYEGGDVFDGGAGNDYITGGGGRDTVIGGLGSDTIYIEVGATDVISADGGEGNDFLNIDALASAGNAIISLSVEEVLGRGGQVVGFERIDIRGRDASGQVGMSRNLIGHSGADYISGGTGADTLSGLGGNDQLNGQNGNDRLVGGDGNDTLYGDNDNDTLLGGDGVDYIVAGSGADLIEGGAGNDTVFGGTESDMLIGGDGNDQLLGDAGDDFIIGGAGADSMWGGSGFDIVSYTDESAGVTRELNAQFVVAGTPEFMAEIEGLIGSAFNDTLTGDTGNNRLDGGAGNDAISGANGNDTLDGGLGADAINGGAGFDFATYANATSGLTLFMSGGTFNTGEANGDTHTAVEGLIGSQFSDIIGGDAGINELRGLDGNDFIYGRGGLDTLLGGDGNDVLSGGADGDRLDGGAGIDVAFYREATAGLTASLLTGGGTGEAVGDTFANIENIWGSDFDDVLSGDNSAGQVYGFAGNDNLSGLDGEDFFYGGQGFDTLTGGAGVDNFFFLSWNDHTNQFGTLEPYEGGDTFTDFTSGTDKIILSRYWFGFGNIGGPAAALTETNANFVTDGTVAAARPSLIWNNTARTLSFDADGNGATQAVLLGTFQGSGSLALSDIWTA